MCHCHFLYDCIYYPPERNIHRLLKQRKQSLRRRKSSSLSLFHNSAAIDDNFCPYTRRIQSQATNDEAGNEKRKFEIGCPTEETCADVRLFDEFFARLPSKKAVNK